MRCSGLSLTPLPFTGSEPRFFYFPTRTQIPTQTHISFFVSSKPGSLKAKAKATINDDFVTEEAAIASLSFTVTILLSIHNHGLTQHRDFDGIFSTEWSESIQVRSHQI